MYMHSGTRGQGRRCADQEPTAGARRRMLYFRHATPSIQESSRPSVVSQALLTREKIEAREVVQVDVREALLNPTVLEKKVRVSRARRGALWPELAMSGGGWLQYARADGGARTCNRTRSGRRQVVGHPTPACMHLCRCKRNFAFTNTNITKPHTDVSPPKIIHIHEYITFPRITLQEYADFASLCAAHTPGGCAYLPTLPMLPA